MTPRLFVRDEAAADMASAASWYDEQRVGLGSEYTRAIRAQLAAIEREPRLYPAVRGVVQRAIVRRFPYAIYFVLAGDEVVVFACLHQRRDPQVWQLRG